jgi:hypothetical protein
VLAIPHRMRYNQQALGLLVSAEDNMENIKESQETKAGQAERVEKAIEGIKKRLGDLQTEQLNKLGSYLFLAISRGHGQKTIGEAYGTLLEICKEGTQEGRRTYDEQGKLQSAISNDRNAAEQ